MSGWRIGIDLGATKIALGLIDPRDKIVARERIPADGEEGPQRLVARIARCVDDLRLGLPEGQALAGVGLCCPGPVDVLNGALVDPPNLPQLHHAPLRRMLADRLRVPVALEHDAKAAALGEFHYGAGRDEKSMVYIVVGTGVGAAIIQGGRLVRGERNSAGELGHITLDREGEPCACGSRGCVETYLSGPWIARRYERACRAALQGNSLLSPASGPRALLSGEQVARLAAHGDEIAARVFSQAGEALGVAVATVAMILNIDLYVIGSSVAKAGDLLLDPARRTVTRYCYRSVGCEVRILPSALGDDGPILGCGWLAKEML